MVDTKATEKEVRLLVGKKLPQAKVARVRVENSSDSAGEPSINIWVVFQNKPTKKELQNTDTVVDAFRTWLSQKGDDRIPLLLSS